MDRRSIVACATGVLGIVTMLLVSSAGTVPVWHEPPPPEANTTIERAPVDEVAANEIADPGLQDPPPEAENNDNVAFRVVAVLVFVALAYLAFIVIPFWIRAFAGRERRNPDEDQPFAILPEVIRPTLVLDTERIGEALREGPARNAIVACWMRLEHDVATAGLPRHPAETSAEFTTRVIAGASIDAGPIAELAALYREARFSTHELGESQRERAVDALQRIHHTLAAPSRAGSGGQR